MLSPKIGSNLKTGIAFLFLAGTWQVLSEFSFIYSFLKPSSIPATSERQCRQMVKSSGT
jgi:hypothetical protein